MRRIFFFTLGMFVLFIASGQTTFGVRTGMNLANVKFYIEGQNPRSKVGWFGGGFLQVGLNQRLFLRPELLYSSKGYASSSRVIGDTRVRLNYMALPILFGFRATKQFHILVGPELGYLLKATTVSESGAKFVNTKEYERFDKGLDLGLLYTLMNRIGVEIRYSYGFKGIMEGYYTDPNGNRVTFNLASHRILQVGLCYRLTK